MNIWKTLVKWIAALAAIAGIAYLLVKYMDQIVEKLQSLCPNKEVPTVQKAEPIAPSVTAEDFCDEEEVIAQEAPVEIPADEPVAEESDFQE